MPFAAALLALILQTAPQYLCPMHPDIVSSEPGTCRKCGMALVVGTALDAADYRLELTTTPAAVEAGRPARLRFEIFHPVTGAGVREFAVVHDRPYHLFVVSQDFTHFDHVHPEQGADGSFSIDLTLPRPGYYRLYSDFLPVGGGPQVIARSLVTARFDGDIVSSLAQLEPDRSLSKTVDRTLVELRIDPGELEAGRIVPLRFHLSDATSQAPVTDLERYLGAWGHALVLSEDGIEYIHAHPAEQLPDLETTLKGGATPDGATPGGATPGGATPSRGGPDITFEALFPKAGRYRIWLQFQREGRTSTASFTVAVRRVAERSPQ
jgi:Heavy metal binding domain